MIQGSNSEPWRSGMRLGSEYEIELLNHIIRLEMNLGSCYKRGAESVPKA